METSVDTTNVILHTQKLTKYYGKHPGAIDLNLQVHPGEVFGFLGPNGAGKTTTIRMLIDAIRPTSGSATVFGLDSHLEGLQVKRRMGYLPGDLALYEHLTGLEMLEHFASIRRNVDSIIMKKLMARFDCTPNQTIRTLSRGNKQKIGLVQALMHQPELLVLDEPTTGLDPLVQQEFYRLIEEIKATGRTIFLSSHVLPEVERICDRVGFIRNGRLITTDDVATLKSRASHELEIHFSKTVSEASFSNIPNVQVVMIKENVLRCKVTGSLETLIRAASRFGVVNIINHEPNLEDIFLGYYEGSNDYAP